MAESSTSLALVDSILVAMASGTTRTLSAADVARVAKPVAEVKPPAAKPAEKPATAAAKPATAAAKPAEKPLEGGEAPKPAKVKAPAVPAAPPAADRPIDVSWLDLRVGHILEASAHPESDKLYIESIDVGEAEPRTILSGLAHYMPLESVKGARVVVVCNLPPRPLAGIPSHGMVLCASDVDKDGNKAKTVFVVPPSGAKVGERITFEQYPGEPVDPSKIKKKKAWETCAPDLATDASGIAMYKQAPWMTSAGACTAADVKSGPIS